MDSQSPSDFLQSLFKELTLAEVTHSSTYEVGFAMALSFVLNCLIAYTYKRTYRGTKYSQDYVHTLLLLGTIVTVVIMVVRGSQSTAFGMFAAFSIIRFRSSVGQARDIGFIFMAMATGLAVGARAYALASMTTPMLCALIGLLSKLDAFAARRVSHLLRVRVNNHIDYSRAFSSAFDEFLSFHQLDSVETVQAGLMTELRFAIILRDPSQISLFLQKLQSLNGNNRILLTPAGNNFVAD
jgi:uncharacterized membrane protein YhiD involved in acid resistance